MTHNRTPGKLLIAVLTALLVACPQPDPTPITTPPADGLRFDPILDAELSTDIESNESVLAGITAAAPVSVGAGGSYSKNGGAYTSNAGTVIAGDRIRLKNRSASTLDTQSVVTLRVGERDFGFRVTTRKTPPEITTPPADGLSFDPVLNAALNTDIVSNESVLKGITAAAPVSISAGGSYSKNGGAYTGAAGTVVAGDRIRLKARSASTLDTQTTVTLRVGQRDFSFNVTTVKTGTEVSFTTKTNQPWNTLVESDAVTLSAVNASTTVAVTGGEYSKNSAAFTAASGTINPGDTIKLRGTSASADNANAAVTLKLGGQDRPFIIQTGKRIPASFNPALTDASDLDPSATVTRSFTVSGITIPSPITVAGASFTVNGVPRTSPGTVLNGDVVAVTATAPAGFSSSLSVNVTVGRDGLNPSGGLAGSFTVTTKSAGTGGMTFIDQTGVAPNASQAEVAWSGSDDCRGIYPPDPASPCLGLSGDPRYLKPLPPSAATFTQSNTVTVSGVSPNTPIAIQGGEYRKNGGAYTAAPGTVSNGDSVQVRVNAIIPGAQHKARMTFGMLGTAFTRDFNVTTINASMTNVWTLNAVTTPVSVPSNSTASSTVQIPATSATVRRVRVLVTLAGSPLRRSDMVIRLVSPGGTSLTLMDFVNSKPANAGLGYLYAGVNPLDPRITGATPPASVSVTLKNGQVVTERPWPWNFLNYAAADGGWNGPVDTIFDSSNFGTNGAAGSTAGIYDVGAGTDTYLDGGIVRNDLYRRCGSDFYVYSAKKYNSDPDGDPNLDLPTGLTTTQVAAINASVNRTLPRAGAIDPYTGKPDGRGEGRIGKFLGEYFEGQCKRKDGDQWYPPVAPDPRVGNLNSLNNTAPGGTWTLQVQNAGSASVAVTITAFKLIFDF